MMEIILLVGSFKKWKVNSGSFRKKSSKVIKKKIKIIGAGRTDKGVHAFGQSANFFDKLKN